MNHYFRSLTKAIQRISRNVTYVTLRSYSCGRPSCFADTHLPQPPIMTGELLFPAQTAIYCAMLVSIINPRRACAARVTVVSCVYVCVYVCMYVCMCVCVSTHTCRITHWNHKREIPTDSAQYRDRFKFCRFS